MSAPARYRAVVIGTGAGGAPAAAELAKAWGEGVALVEAGRRFVYSDFNQREADMVPRLYAQGGLQATEDASISLLQGRAVGGSTVINDALCFRPPPELVERWRPAGCDLDAAELSSLADEVEQALSVETIEKAQVNRANYLVGLGAARKGWAGERLRHNAPGCLQCGFRHFGCSYDRKQSMNLTYVPRALSHGARLLDDTQALRLERRGEAWCVHTSKGELLAEHVVVCAGAVQTPVLLLRSGIPAGEGLQLHLQTVAWGDFEDPVDGFNGIPMAYGVLEFADVYGRRGPGYLMEGVSVQPMSFSVQPQADGALKTEILSRYRHLAGALMVLRGKSRGRVSLGPGGRPFIEHPLLVEDTRRTGHFLARATELFLAAGATRVLLPHREVRWVTAPPEELEVAPGLLYLYAAHLFGGACRGEVTDGEGRVKGQPNLWVLDASAFPEPLGVNPQVTLAALALKGARQILAGS